MKLAYRLLKPFLSVLHAETAHKCVLYGVRFLWLSRLWRRIRPQDNPILSTTVWGKQFPNPVGLSAGFDKDAEVVDPMLCLGFGFVEVGAITPKPQKGNPGRRLFRLAKDRAIINRFGFPNSGLEIISSRLKARALDKRRVNGIVGANIGYGSDKEDSKLEEKVEDYVVCADKLIGIVDYIVLNVSCPNTRGLAELQESPNFEKLIDIFYARCGERISASNTSIIVKISPDLGDNAVKSIAHAVVEKNIDGLIISNTTTDENIKLKLVSADKDRPGGISGRPLFDVSTKLVAKFYRLTEGKVPIIGVGGVESADHAYTKIRAGASLVALYSALVYEGPSLVDEIKRGLAQKLREDGFKNVSEAVGIDARPSTGVNDERNDISLSLTEGRARA